MVVAGLVVSGLVVVGLEFVVWSSVEVVGWVAGFCLVVEKIVSLLLPVER